MKIDVRRIPAQGLMLEEELAPGQLDLDTDIIKFPEPIRIRAEVARITNTVTVNLSLEAHMYVSCGRCLEEYKTQIKRNLKLNYPVDEPAQSIDLDPDIREELVLDCPLKPLCKPDCKGICAKCGGNLNEGNCKC